MSVQVIVVFLKHKGIISIFSVVVVQCVNLLPEFVRLLYLSHCVMLFLRDCSYEGD